MKALKTIPEQVDVDHTISGVRFSAVAKEAQVDLYGGPAVNGGQVDFTAYYDALSGPDQTVITDFLKEIMATATGVSVGNLVGNVFVADV